MKRTSMEGQPCAVARALDVIGDWWTLLIVRDALAGLRRFGEFQRSLGAAKNILASRLRVLVAEGILESAPASDGSAYHEYLLTDKGRALVPVLVALGQWGSAHAFQEGELCLTPLDALHRRPLQKLTPHSMDGAPLDDAEVFFASGLDIDKRAPADAPAPEAGTKEIAK
jgi:DNA-binding HxlR family transcriptional regulator